MQMVCCLLGAPIGVELGVAVEINVGLVVGLAVGIAVGNGDGSRDGDTDGMPLGDDDDLHQRSSVECLRRWLFSRLSDWFF